MPGPGDLYTAAELLLSAAGEALLTAPAGGIPMTSQAIWPGAPSFDCIPALYVHAGGAQFADTFPLSPPLQPHQQIVTTGEVNLVTMTITVLRCVPVVDQTQQSVLLPSAAAISQAASDCYGDLWAIWNHLKNLHRSGALFQTPSGRREFRYLPAVPVRTSGGAGGWEIPVSFELPGYSE